MLITNWLVDDVTPYPGNHRVMRDAADRVTKLLGYISAEVAAIDMQARADAPPLLAESQPKAAAPASEPDDWGEDGAETDEIGPTAHALGAPAVTPSPDAQKAPERPAGMALSNALLALTEGMVPVVTIAADPMHRMMSTTA